MDVLIDFWGAESGNGTPAASATPAAGPDVMTNKDEATDFMSMMQHMQDHLMRREAFQCGLDHLELVRPHLFGLQVRLELGHQGRVVR